MTKGFAMRRTTAILATAFLLTGCATYHRQAVHFSGAVTQDGNLKVIGPAQPIGVTGIGPVIWDVDPDPDLPSYAQARLREWVSIPSGSSVQCTVAASSAQISNMLTKGSIATSLQMSCQTNSGNAFVAAGRDVHEKKVGMKGIDLTTDLQPGIDACLHQIAQQIKAQLPT